jgi:methionine-rich copper-binding protein CopC
LKHLIAALAVLLTILSAAAPAYAHVELASASPANGATLGTAPESVTLRFTGPVKPAFTMVTVTGPAGVSYQDSTPEVDANTVIQRLRPLNPGSYMVAYEVVAADGAPVTGAIRFHVGPATSSSSPSSSVSSTSSWAGTGLEGWTVLLMGGILLVLAAVAIAIRRKRRAAGPGWS